MSIEYEFRRTEDGHWQRRAPGGAWLTLHVIRKSPPESHHRRPGVDRPTSTNEWEWL